MSQRTSPPAPQQGPGVKALARGPQAPPPPAAPAAALAAAPVPSLGSVKDLKIPINYLRPVRDDMVAIPRPLDPATESLQGDNFGFRSLNEMAGAFIDADLNVRGGTKGFRQKGEVYFEFPSAPPNAYLVTIHPVKNLLFLFGDLHNRSVSNPLATLAIRMSTDSAMLPPVSHKETFPPGLFVIYMNPERHNKVAIHHGHPHWIHFENSAGTPVRRAWMKVHLGNVLNLGEAMLEAFCGRRDPDARMDVFVHFDSNRIDCYFWSLKFGAQVAVCFEPWYGDNDGFGCLHGTHVRLPVGPPQFA